MQKASDPFTELLPTMATAWILVGLIASGLVVTGLLLLSVIIRSEDANLSLYGRASGPIARLARHVVNLRVYSNNEFRYEPPAKERTRIVPAIYTINTPYTTSKERAPHITYGRHRR